jgi:type IV secretion system protein VirB9
MFGGKPPQIVCQVGMITDIELEPGERVENYSVTDGDRWSVSAAWSGHVNNLVTHVLLRTFFPDVKSKMAIYTNRRVYEMELVSGLNVAHMANVGFRYPGVITEDEPEEIPPGKYRDLLVKYKIIEDPQAEEKAAKRIDGADLNFRYEIKHIGKKKPLWIPKSVYDADGRTFIVLPRGAVGQGEGKITLSPSLFIVDKGARFIAKISPVKEDVFVVDRLFDEAIIAANGIEVSIRRKFSID